VVTLYSTAGALTLHAPGLYTDSDIRWLDGVDYSAGSGFTVALTDDQSRAIAAGVSAIAVRGTVRLTRPRITASMPFASGASAVHDGTRIRVERLTRGPDSVAVDLITSDVLRTQSGQGWVGNTPFERISRVALVNDSRHEAVTITRTKGQGSGVFALLPGLRLDQNKAHFRVDRQGSLLPARDAAWYDGSRLVVLEWVPRGEWTMDVPVAVP
jgi:hypothetical protein